MAFVNYTLSNSTCGFLLGCLRKWDTVKNGSCKLYFSNIHGNVSTADLRLSDFFLHLVFFMRKLQNRNLPKCFGVLYLWMELQLLWPGCEWEYRRIGCRRANRIQGEGPIHRIWLERAKLLLGFLWGVNSSNCSWILLRGFVVLGFSWVGKFDYFKSDVALLIVTYHTATVTDILLSLSQCLLSSLFPLPGVLENAPRSAVFHSPYNFEMIRNICISKLRDVAIACCKPDHDSGPLWDTGQERIVYGPAAGQFAILRNSLEWPYLTNVFGYWVAESTNLCKQPVSPQKWWMWKDIYVCTVQEIHVHGQFGLAFCTGFFQSLAERSAVKCTLTLAAMQWLSVTSSGTLQMHTGVIRIVQEQQ